MELGKRQSFWIGDYSGGSQAALWAAAHADWPSKGLDRDPGALKKINTGARYTPKRLSVDLNLFGHRNGKRDFRISDRIRGRPGTSSARPVPASQWQVQARARAPSWTTSTIQARDAVERSGAG